MSWAEAPQKLKFVLPNGRELVAEICVMGSEDPAHLAEYLIDATDEYDGDTSNILRAFVDTLPDGTPRTSLRLALQSDGGMIRIKPWANLGAGVTPRNLPSTFHLGRQQAIAIIVQSRGEHHKHNQHACSLRDICYRCRDSFRQLGHMLPFPNFCASNSHYGRHQCGNCIWNLVDEETCNISPR